MILLTIFEYIQGWIDKYANWNTFFGLLIGIIGIILAVYFYKKQQNSTKLKKETDACPEETEPYLGVSIKVDNVFRKFAGYGASCGDVIRIGNFKANYDVEAELIITIQNESLNTAYELEVSYTPNNYSNNYKLIDTRQNKLQPLEGNKHFVFKLRIMQVYYDVYYQDVDKDIHEINQVGKGTSILSGATINISYRDSKHKLHSKTEVLN